MKLMTALHFLASYYTVIFVWISSISAIFILFSRNYVFPARLFAGLIFLLSIVETIENLLAFHHLKNHFLFNLAEPFRFLGVAYLFYFNLNNLSIRKAILGFMIVYPAVFLIDNLWLQGFYTLNTDSYVIGASFILLLCVAYLWQLYLSDDTRSIFVDPIFWISVSFLFYCAVSIPYIGMMNYLWKSNPTFTRIYYIHIYDISIVVHNLLLATGFICMRIYLKQKSF